ncbi:MAG: hypothetical protein HQ512_12135 [Rhodospirillales bacterium]|nr:hypothetical protein [Rhodospirillales bacterium]
MAKPSLIKPKKRLRDKVRTTGGPTPEEAVLRAVNAAEDLMEGYQGWAVDDLQKLWEAFQKTAASGTDVSKMYDIVHEVRGQGGSFGFPLISSIGDSLCKYLDRRKSLSSVELEVIKIHILAMKAVFRQSLKGDAGGLAQEIPDLLFALRERT